MRAIVIGCALGLTCAMPVQAEFLPVTEEADFLRLLEGRELRNGLLNITLVVAPDGTISGNAVRWAVTGSWAWKDGYFCREMDWSGMAIEYNCQLVEAEGDERMRFTVDQGAGESATFSLR